MGVARWASSSRRENDTLASKTSAVSCRLVDRFCFVHNFDRTGRPVCVLFLFSVVN